MMLEQLGARERQIMEIVYRLGQASVREVLNELPDSPHYSTVRTMLNKLEKKGHLEHVEEGRRYLYLPTTPKRETQRSILASIVRNLFAGSTARAMTALLEMNAELSEEEIRELRSRIDLLEKEDR